MSGSSVSVVELDCWRVGRPNRLRKVERVSWEILKSCHERVTGEREPTAAK